LQPTPSAARVRSSMAGRWLVFAATVLWASTATLARFVFRSSRVDSFTVVEMRLLIASAVLLVILFTRKRSALKIEWRDAPYFLTLGLLGVAAVQGSYYYTISKLGVGLAILLQYLAPAIIVAWYVLRGQPASARTTASVIVAIAGTALLVRGVHPAASGSHPIDWAVGFASAFFFAFYVAYSKRGLAHYRPETVLFWTFTIAGLFWACVTPPWRIVAAHYDGALWAMFFTLGMFSTLVPFTLFYRGLERMPAAEASVVATLEPVVALLSAWGFLGEALAPRQWIGAALVLAASVMASAQDPARPAAAADRT